MAKAENDLEVCMASRPNVSEERKQQILEAAIAVFARLGFRATRMDDVAEQAGLSKGALYLYYKSKDAIIAALLQHLFAQEFKQLQALVESESKGPVVEQLLILTRQLASMMQWVGKLMPITFEFYAIAGRDKAVRQFLKEYFTDYRTLLARLISGGRAGRVARHRHRGNGDHANCFVRGSGAAVFRQNRASRWAEQEPKHRCGCCSPGCDDPPLHEQHWDAVRAQQSNIEDGMPHVSSKGG